MSFTIGSATASVASIPKAAAGTSQPTKDEKKAALAAELTTLFARRRSTQQTASAASIPIATAIGPQLQAPTPIDSFPPFQEPALDLFSFSDNEGSPAAAWVQAQPQGQEPPSLSDPVSVQLLQAKQELANLSAMHAALTSQLQQHGANSGAAAAHSATGNENSVAAGTGSPWSQAETPNQPSTQSSPEDELGQVNQEVIRLYRLCLDLEAQLKQLKAKDAAHMELPTASAASIPTATATAAATASQIPSKADTSTSPLQHLAQSFMPPSLPTASIRDRLRLTKLKTQATQHTASAPTPTPTATAAATASPIPSKADTSTSHSWSLENTLSMDPLPSFGASSLGSLKGREENSATDWPQSTSFPQALNAPALANELRQAQLEMQQLRLEYKKLIVADEVRKIINASLISELAMQKRQTDKLEKLSNEQAEQLKALAALKHTGTEPKKQSAAASPFRPSGSTIKQKPRRLSL